MEEIVNLASAKAKLMAEPRWEDKVESTKIDRRHAKRLRPMEVIGLGLERTGTLSLRAALYELGYFDVYHMTSIMLENQKDAEMWVEAFNAKFNGMGTFPREKWDALTGHCMAAVDKPVSMLGPELIQAYPEAKIILTVRDSPEAWHRSVMGTIYPLTRALSPYRIRYPGNNPLNHLLRLFAPRGALMEFSRLWCEFGKVDHYPENAAQLYLDHNSKIRQVVPKERLLEFNVKEGWEPLCSFLGKPIPDKPFPSINDTDQFKANITKIRYIMGVLYLGNVVKYLGVPVLAIVAGWLYYERVSM